MLIHIQITGFCDQHSVASLGEWGAIFGNKKMSTQIYGPDDKPLPARHEPPRKKPITEKITDSWLWKQWHGSSGFERTVGLVIAALALGVASLACYFAHLSLKKPAPKPIVIHQADPTYIEGTTIRLSDLDNEFPYGWVAFRRATGDQWTHQVDPHGHLRYNINWDDVKIEPDPSTEQVKWSIPFSAIGAPFQISIENGMISNQVPMIVGQRIGFYYLDFGHPEVLPYVETLSNDQRRPVFALGFRIPTSDEVIVNLSKIDGRFRYLEEAIQKYSLKSIVTPDRLKEIYSLGFIFVIAENGRVNTWVWDYGATNILELSKARVAITRTDCVTVAFPLKSNTNRYFNATVPRRANMLTQTVFSHPPEDAFVFRIRVYTNYDNNGFICAAGVAEKGRKIPDWEKQSWNWGWDKGITNAAEKFFDAWPSNKPEF
jgi:hypothetical protein